MKIGALTQATEKAQLSGKMIVLFVLRSQIATSSISVTVIL